jgi:hypothetical protein
MRRIGIAVALILMLATTAYAGEIFRYVDSDGTVSFTDDVKRIPAAYKDVAEKVVLEGEFKNLDSLTIVTVTPEIVIPVVEVPDTTVTCNGFVTVTSERRQFSDGLSDYNRRVYLVHDECGNLVSETFYQPEIRIER